MNSFVVEFAVVFAAAFVLYAVLVELIFVESSLDAVFAILFDDFGTILLPGK